ncbi:hypothetical protein VN97_g3598 [Penicillium thymicola]|uniref:Uncharacterized protein n=1 Tax=Penicillium thymicola TaxID=293382 RepID=A0AAI9TMP3_PENTH|nr:hypothetical protein VN97_g3598 [Penicillium thymicola]
MPSFRPNPNSNTYPNPYSNTYSSADPSTYPGTYPGNYPGNYTSADPSAYPDIDNGLGLNHPPDLSLNHPGLNQPGLDVNPALNPALNPGPGSSTGANAGTTSTGANPGTPNTRANTGPTSTPTPTPNGSYWRVRGSQPQGFAQPNKLLCNCPNHRENWWPVDHAELVISPCALRCPYCDKFNRAEKRVMASNLRRHITMTHIEKHPATYGTLHVAPGMTPKNQ